MALKVVVFYTQFQSGWTETYYYPSNILPQDFFANNGPNSWFNFVQYRNSTVRLYGVRASVIGSPRVSSTYVFTGANALFGQGGATPETGPEPAATDAFVDLYDTANHRRPIYLRGLNEVDVNIGNTGIPMPSATLVRGINMMVQAMATKGLSIAVQQRPPAGGQTWVQVTSVAQSTTSPGIAVINLAAAGGLPFAPGSQVVFKGIPRDDLPGFPRIASVINYTGAGAEPFLTVTFRVRASVIPYLPARMYVTNYILNFFPISTSTFVAFKKRATGRPTNLSRGRTRPAVRAL